MVYIVSLTPESFKHTAMTGTELSDDALRSLRARRDTLAARSVKAFDADERATFSEHDAAGIRAFRSWFSRQRKEAGIVMSSESMLHVQPRLSDRFNIGMHEMRYFIGIPPDVKEWFTSMPWLHVALLRGSPALSLVCERVRHIGASMPEFSLNFEVGCFGVIKMLTNYHYLDVREIWPSTRDEAVAGVVHIGRDVLMTLDIRVVDGAQTFQNLLDGRNPNGLQNRSAVLAVERKTLDGEGRTFGPPLGLDVPGTFRSNISKKVRQESR